MANIQTFDWCVMIGPQGTVEQTVLEASFGDGYVQRSGVGINNEKQSWPIAIRGDGATIGAVRDFLRDHAGWKSFFWTPPLGVAGLYAAPEGYQITAHGADRYTLNATFVQTFTP